MRESAKRIVWAVDVLEDVDAQASALRLLVALSRAEETWIYPVFVLSPSHTRVPGSAFTIVREAYRALAEKRMAEILMLSDLKNVSELTVLIHECTSLRGDVGLLLEHARLVQADAILVATHARRQAPQIFLGSFAETLALQSTVSILAVNPDALVRERLARILFPVLPSAKSWSTFRRASQFAKAHDAQLMFFYKSVGSTSAIRHPEIAKYQAEADEDNVKLLQDWKAVAQSEGISADVVFDRETKSASAAIIQAADRCKSDLIIMHSAASPIRALLLGSVARQVIREAQTAVWIVRDGQ